MREFGRWLGILVFGVLILLLISNCEDPSSDITGNDPQETLGVTISAGQVIDGMSLPFGSIRISRTGIGFPVTETVSVNASDFDSGSIIWEVVGVGFFSGETVIGRGASFILNAADVRYNSLGGHTLTLSVRKNGIQYQREIPFTIMQ